MSWTLLPALLACTGKTPDTDATTAPEVPLDWGVVDACDTPADGGFGDFYARGEAVLVHGDSAEDAAFAEQVDAWYSAFFDTLTLRAASELTDADRALDLMIVGTPDTNALLTELSGHLPVWFESDRFTFGGYRYDEVGHGIALIHPSPFADEAMVAVYGGNSLGGAQATFSVPTGARDYETLRGRGTLQQEGDLCRDGDLWGFVAARDQDLRADWEAWVGGLEATQGDGHVFYAVPGSYAAEDMDTLAPFQDGELARALETLDVAPLDADIRWFLYPDNETKGEVTGSSGNGHANAWNYEVHAVYSGGVKAIGAHEDVHVVATHRVGETDHALMGEGLAVWLDGGWWGEPLEHWVETYRGDGSLPALVDLIDDFWGTDDGITYPVAGHVVGWLHDGWGLDVVKEVYVAEDLAAALEAATGLTVSELEQAWLDSV